MTAQRRLVVIGEDPLAKLALAIGTAERRAENVRFVELTPDRIAGSNLDFLADDPVEFTDAFVAIGPSALNFARFDLWAKLKTRGYRCATLVHPQAYLDPSSELADNVLVGPCASIEPEVRIGRGTIIGAAAAIGAASVVGPWNWIARGVVVGAQTKMGSYITLGAGVQFADRTEFPGPGEIDVAGTYRGKLPAGTFISPEFPTAGARLIQSD